HYLFAELRQAVVLRLVGGRVGPVERLGVRQRHVAHAQLVQHAQYAERVVDGVAAFNTDQRGDLALLVDAHDVVGGVRHLEGVGAGGDHTLDDIDLFERHADGRAFFAGFRRDVSRPELSTDAALDQARDVGVQLQLLLRLVEVDLAEGQITFFAELP